jgi:hypothetical protein
VGTEAKAEVISRRNEDGSIDVWAKGWHVKFPKDEGPITKKAPPPAGVSGELASGISVEPVGERIGVAVGDWMALVGEDEVTMNATRPKSRPSGAVRYRRAFQ